MMPAVLMLLILAHMGAGSSARGGYVFAIPTKIAVSADATEAENSAATELTSFMNRISGAPHLYAVQRPQKGVSQLAVGYGAALALGIEPQAVAGLGLEGYVLITNASSGVAAGSAVLTGGLAAPRGALYAVNAFLEQMGVQFLAQDVTLLPARLPSALPILDVRFTPQLEYRQIFEYGLNQNTTRSLNLNLHSRLNKAEVQRPSFLGPGRGGSVEYANPPGFVHTSYSLLSTNGSEGGGRVPPLALFESNNEWFWPRDKPIYGQLCWSNLTLQHFIIGNLRAQLRRQPNATIVSVSQNVSNFCPRALFAPPPPRTPSPSPSAYASPKVAVSVSGLCRGV
jgi:hypothetical protein